MNKSQVVELLSNLAFKPGWTFEAREIHSYEWWHAPTTDVIFMMTCETVDTDRQYACKGYPERKTLDWELAVSSDKYDTEDELLRSVFDLLMDIELHESREFFRQKNENWEAPFHPHKMEGNARWELTDSVSVSAR